MLFTHTHTHTHPPSSQFFPALWIVAFGKKVKEGAFYGPLIVHSSGITIARPNQPAFSLQRLKRAMDECKVNGKDNKSDLSERFFFDVCM